MNRHINDLVSRFPQLNECKNDIFNAYETLKKTFEGGGKLLICGNGGSASDCDHIVGELMKGFKLKRPLRNEDIEKLKQVSPGLGDVIGNNLQGALPAISLSDNNALHTACVNDMLPDLVFAQQVNGYGKPGDSIICISTSGKSKNVINAAITAKSKGLKVIGLTCSKENDLMKYCDVCIGVPEVETYKIQELHMPIYHCLCIMLEEEFFG